MRIFNTKKWFTLVEILIVVILIGIILSMVFSLGFDYVTKMRVRTHKESFISNYNIVQADNRSSNYIKWEKYTDLRISTMGGSFNYFATNSNQLVPWPLGPVPKPVPSYETYHYNKDFFYEFFELTPTASPNVYDKNVVGRTEIFLQPYKIWCKIWNFYPEAIGVEMHLTSKLNSDEYCFEIREWTCKLTQVECTP